MARIAARLLFAHADAWGVAIGIAAVCAALHGQSDARAVLAAALIGVCTWLGFALNDWYDALTDAADPRKVRRNAFAGLRTPRQAIARAFVVGFALAGLALMVGFGWRGLVVFVVGALAAWAYSAPPVRLRTRPGWDVLTHAAFVETFPYSIALLLLALPIRPVDALLLLCLALSSAAAQIEQQIRDHDGDRAHGRTFTIAIGVRRAGWLLRGLSLAVIALIVWGLLAGIIPVWLIPVGLAALPIFADRLLRPLDAPRREGLVWASLVIGLGCALLIWTAG